MYTAAFVDELWGRTPVPAAPGATKVCGTGIRAAGTEVALGHDSLGRRHVLIPTGTHPHGPFSFRAAGVRATGPRELMLGDERHQYVDVYCTRADANAVFSRVAAELLNEAEKDPERAAIHCIELLQNLSRLFGIGAAEFGRDQVVGLLGELIVLLRLAKLNPDAVAWWTGPSGGVHDFRRGRTALEVKTTLQSTARIHTVSSIDQLEAPYEGTLGFVSIQLRKVPEGPVSIACLLDDLRTANVSVGELSERLCDIGFVCGKYPELESETFEIVDFRVYAVDDGFPRVVRRTFVDRNTPPGVVAMRYDIDISGNPPTPMAIAAVEASFAAFAKR